VRAARRASGDAADVGTADELWGDDSSISAAVADSTQMPQSTASLPAVLPTHVEIMPRAEQQAHLASMPARMTAPHRHPQAPAPETGSQGVSRPVDNEGNVAAGAKEHPSLPVLKERTANGDKDTRNANGGSVSSSTARGRGEQETLATPVSLGGELPEMVSMGGESLGSFSEFETVSFAEDSGEIPCGCLEHVGRTIINDMYAADVETIFQLLFIDPNFFRDFLKARNTINIDMSEWQEQADGSKLRDLNYTVALNYSFGPKFSPTTERQVYSNTTQPGTQAPRPHRGDESQHPVCGHVLRLVPVLHDSSGPRQDEAEDHLQHQLQEELLGSREELDREKCR
jgi:hypothetical protein